MKSHKIRNLICEALLETLNNENYRDEGYATSIKTPEQIEYARGLQAGLKARTHGGRYVLDNDELKSYPKNFIKGYKKATGESLWDRFNDRLTTLLGQAGYSRTRGL